MNHSIFWKNLSAEGGEASGELLAAISEYFGSYEAFTKHFTAAAMGHPGFGLGLPCLGQHEQPPYYWPAL